MCSSRFQVSFEVLSVAYKVQVVLFNFYAQRLSRGQISYIVYLIDRVQVQISTAPIRKIPSRLTPLIYSSLKLVALITFLQAASVTIQCLEKSVLNILTTTLPPRVRYFSYSLRDLAKQILLERSERLRQTMRQKLGALGVIIESIRAVCSLIRYQTKVRGLLNII